MIIAQSQREPFVQRLPGTLVDFKMVAVPDGTFAGQSIKGIWIGETEVTWDLFDVWAFRTDLTPEQNAADFDAENRPSRPYGAPDRGYGHQGYAALSMTYGGGAAFCKWLSEKTGRRYRLPTEAEWEYAARAGSAAEPSPLGDHAWFWDNSDSVAQPVKSKKPNAWGLYDVLGNVAEWCSPNQPVRPSGAAAFGGSGVHPSDAIGKEPVIRGGHFYSKADHVKFTSRLSYDPAWQLRDAQQPKSSWWLSDGEMVGMRLVCER